MRYARYVLLGTLALAFVGSASAAPGDLDPSFDGDGKVTTDFGGPNDLASAAAMQPDGKIVAAGYCDAGATANFCLARYNADGSLDTSFDGDGKVVTPAVSDTNGAKAVALQGDGKIVAAGQCDRVYSSTWDFCLARYNTDGSLDRSFGSTIGANYDSAHAVAVQGDGKIVVAGLCGMVTYDFCLARYNPDGSLDSGFDGDGKVTTDLGTSYDWANDVALQGDGKIVAAGLCGTEFCLARYNADGSLDSSFDGDGKVTTAIGSPDRYGRAVILQGDGKIVFAGYCVIGATLDFCLARYNADGSLDTSFDGDGKVNTAIGTSADAAQAVDLQGDGKITAAGHCLTDTGHYEFCLARYNPDGSLDDSFGGDGKVTTAIGGSDNLAFAAALQGDGKIVVAGYCDIPTRDFCLARYEWELDGDGVPDATDNCPSTANPGQENFDGDSMGDMCDGDDDGDGYWDDDELAKGSNPFNAARTPEHCDGADNDGDTAVDEEPVGASWDIDGDTVKDCFDTNVDTDGDGIVNTLDADDDMDGRTDAQERKLSTDELGACSTGMSHDGWASDRDRDKDADIGDVIQNFYGKIGSPANYDARSDADGDNDVDIGDVIQLYGGGKAGTKCATLTYTNSTGGPVDDIHIVWSTAIAEVFVARDSQLAGWPSRVISGGGTVLDMERPDGSGDLAAGGTLRMVVRGTNPVVASCQWTLEGVDVGAC